ncbi:MAG: hypothetical protein WA089_06220 [Anaerolineae bacterium]
MGIQISNPIAAARFLVTTTGAQTLTLNSFGVSREIVVDWGDGSNSSYTGTALRTHAYAGAGTWTVTIADPLAVTTFDVRDSKITLNSANVAMMTNVTSFIATTLKAGTFSSADVSAWRPTYFALLSMPAGYAGTFSSADVSAWRPTTFILSTMPAGYVVTAGGGFAGWTTTSNFRVQGNALSQATVNAILWELYQAAATPRTVTGGTINVGGSNAAPSGTYQAPASCPVTVATPGKEVAHALLNDGCAVGFNKWTTVTVTA